MYTSSSFFLENVTCYFFGLCFFCVAPFSRERNFSSFFTRLQKNWRQKNFCVLPQKRSFISALFVVSVLLRFFLLNKKEEEEEESAFESV